MNKILFICPYFGKFPLEQMKLWLKSCEKNEKINWLIITDDKHPYSFPKNVMVKYTSLKELKERFQKKFKFEISLENPYKLCDYKPLYGFLFEEEISGYEYWGHCDLSDCIFGDIQKYLMELISDKPDKIGFFGHMTLYRNIKSINERFMIKTKSNLELSSIIGTNKNMAFDELNNYSINEIYRENDFCLKRMDYVYFDITPASLPFKYSIRDDNFNFIKYASNKYIFEWDNGKLYKITINGKEICKTEIGYVHYQKRKFKYKINLDKIDHYYIVPNEFIYISNLNIKVIKKYLKNELFNKTFFIFKFKRLKYKLKKNIFKKN